MHTNTHITHEYAYISRKCSIVCTNLLKTQRLSLTNVG